MEESINNKVECGLNDRVSRTMTVRERTEQIERETLSPFAALSCMTRGRQHTQETQCDLRTEYQRDRDRILHSKAFRRLKHKTQVFISPESDHYRTRLTHTLEVSQIARTVARALRLNEDLTEAIALGHDLGHTPFGHSGESALDMLSPQGFKHYKQSLRVVDRIEKLNLTFEVRDGIYNHTVGTAATLEGKLIKIADKIAYINHDIDDSIRAGILDPADIPTRLVNTLGYTCSNRIDTLVRSLVENSNAEEIKMQQDTQKAFTDLHEFMYENVYLGKLTKVEKIKVPIFMECIYKYFVAHPNEIPLDFRDTINEEGLDTTVCDYIAGMTDDFAVRKFSELFIPVDHF